MAERTIYVFAKDGVSITRDINGGKPVKGDVIGDALNGDAFSWENPSNLTLKFSGPLTAITFDDADGVLTDDPFSGSTVVDQRLTEPLTINGKSYTPNDGTTRWQNPAPVNVENEYEVTLYDDAGTAYRMVGVSITQGYSTNVVGVTFDGLSPPPGTALHYIQRVSTYGGSGQSLTIPDEAVCFLSGTMIETPIGPRTIDDLQAGMSVLTLNHGPQPIRWIGRSSVCGLGKLAPIRIKAGVFENHRDLYLSPNHRILVRSTRAELSFGQRDVLVPAKALIDGTSVIREPMLRADYLHIMFDEHEMVFSEGIATESLFTGAVTLDILTTQALTEIHAIFPDLAASRKIYSHMPLTMSESRYLMQKRLPCDVQAITLHAA